MSAQNENPDSFQLGKAPATAMLPIDAAAIRTRVNGLRLQILEVQSADMTLSATCAVICRRCQIHRA